MPEIGGGKMQADTLRLQAIEPSKTMIQSIETLSSNRCKQATAAPLSCHVFTAHQNINYSANFLTRQLLLTFLFYLI